MAKDSRVGKRPQSGFLICCFERIICPRIAGIKQAVAAFPFIKTVIIAVVRVGNDRCFLSAETTLDVRDEFLVLGLWNIDFDATLSFLQAVEKRSMHGRIPKVKHGVASGRNFKIWPLWRIEIEAFVAPAKANILISAVLRKRVVKSNFIAPIFDFIRYRNDDVGVYAVAFDVDCDIAIRLLIFGIYRNPRQDKNHQAVNNNKTDNPNQQLQ